MDFTTSIWEATANAAPDAPPLAESLITDVAVVGAGFTGLSAALRLAEGGAGVTVLDAADPCAGASGRNGGQVIPGLKYDPDKIAAVFGDYAIDFAGNAADAVFALIDKHAIRCDARRDGWIQASVKRSHLPALHRRAALWAERGAPVEVLGGAAIAALTGSETFAGGWIDRRAGGLHPLNYARGLLGAAMAAGARVHGHSRAVRTGRVGRRWRIETSNGATVTADHVVIATNGYTDDLVPRLRRSIVPATSYQIATGPIPGDLLRSILPGGALVSDTRRIANYFRVGPGGRLMIGGRGSLSGPRSAGDYDFLLRALHRFFPATVSIPVEFRWFGRLAVTRDFLPHVHQPFPDMTAALGYSGRGVAMATAVGTAIGAHLIDRSRPLPLKLTAIHPLPLHALHRQYAAMTIYYMALRDALER